MFAADSLLMHQLVTGHELWGMSVGTNQVQKFSKNSQCWIGVGSSFQAQTWIFHKFFHIYCCKSAQGVPAILLPFAVVGLGTEQRPKPPQQPTQDLHMEGNVLLPGRRAEVPVPHSGVGCTVTERENQQQKGTNLLWLRRALCNADGHSGTNLAKVLNLQVTSSISWVSFVSPPSCKRRPRLLK